MKWNPNPSLCLIHASSFEFQPIPLILHPKIQFLDSVLSLCAILPVPEPPYASINDSKSLS